MGFPDRPPSLGLRGFLLPAASCPPPFFADKHDTSVLYTTPFTKQLPDQCYKLQPWSRWHAPSLRCVLLPVHSHPHWPVGRPGDLSEWLSFLQAMCLLSRLHPSQGQTSPFRAHGHLVKG